MSDTRERERRAAEIGTRPDSALQPPFAHDADDFADAPRSQSLAAVFGNASRRGEWEPPEVTQVFVMFGRADLDFTRALMLSGVTEVSAFVLFGSVHILLPEGLEVEVTGNALLGQFKQSTRVSRARRLLRRTLRAARGEPDDDELEPHDEEPPLLRVGGLAVFGSVNIVTRS